MNFHMTDEERQRQRDLFMDDLKSKMDESAKPAMTHRVRRFEKIDAGELRAPVRRDNGFLQVEGRLARTGIQEYWDGAGASHRELRLPEEVFDAKSLSSFQQVPVTNTHPPVLLDARNAKQYAVGSVGEDVRRDGEFMVARMMITDEQAIASAEAGRSQLSNGYTCWLDQTQDPALVEKWGPYDFIQREIRGNHVALVDVARAGPEARLRLDRSDALSGHFDEEISIQASGAVGSGRRHHENPGSEHMGIKFQLDGFEVEVQDANAKSVIERAVANAKKDSADQLATAQTALAEANKSLDASKKDSAEWKSKHDTVHAKVETDAAAMKECPECDGTGKVDGKKCDGCDGEGKVPMKKMADAAHIGGIIARAAVRQAELRAKVIDKAREVLGTGAKLDGKTLGEIKAMVIGKIAPGLKLDGESVEFVDSAYKTALATLPAERPHIDKVRGALGTGPVVVVTPTEDQGVDQPDARAAMRKRNNDSFVRPGAKK